MELKIDNIIVQVSDMDRSIHFYKHVLGLAVIVESEHWSEFNAGTVNLALHPGQPVPEGAREQGTHIGTLHVTFSVPDIDQACALLRERGIAVNGPQLLEGMALHTATFSDPDGISLGLQAS